MDHIYGIKTEERLVLYLNGAATAASALGVVILLLDGALLRLLGLLLGREGLDAPGVGGDAIGGTTGVAVEGVEGEVLHVVTHTMIVLVVRFANDASEELGLLLSLDLLGTGKDASGGDAVEDKGLVVGATVEFGGNVADALFVKELLEEMLDLTGASRAGHVEGTAVTVVDQVGVVGRSDHVEVEVESDLLLLPGAEAVDVVGTAEEAKLLSSPETEADGVLETEVGEGLGDIENANDARAVVVDTGACHTMLEKSTASFG